MKNIKTIELVSPAFGLPAGSVLTRLDGQSSFEYVSEHVGDLYSSTHHVSVSPGMVNGTIAKATEWFERRRPAREVIAELEEKLAEATACNERTNETVQKYEKLIGRIDDKRSEFEAKLAKLDKELEEDLVAGESIEWADEAMTVYYNMIDLLKKLTA